jgi:hypothetical protein
MLTKKIHNVDLHSRCFAYVGDESDPASWQLCIRVLGSTEKTVNAIKCSLNRFDAVKIPDAARERAWYTLRGAALTHGVEFHERSFSRPATETTEPPATQPVKPLHQPPAEPTFKDAELDALIAESDRKAEQWLRILNLE